MQNLLPVAGVPQLVQNLGLLFCASKDGCWLQDGCCGPPVPPGLDAVINL